MVWEIALVANIVMFFGYGAILLAFLVPLVRSRQLGSNPLGLATSIVFLTCAIHHGSHAAHMLFPYLGVEVDEGRALRAAWSWPTVAWDLITAGAAVYYWSIRRSFGALIGGAAIFDDLKAEHRRALQINDDVVQGLAVAHMALALDERDTSKEAMVHALASARTIISDLLGEGPSGHRLVPGDLRRAAPAAVLEDRHGATPAGGAGARP